MSPEKKGNIKGGIEWIYRSVALFFLVSLYNQNRDGLKKIDTMEINYKVQQMQLRDDRRDIDKNYLLITNNQYECVKRNDETRQEVEQMKSQIFNNPYKINHN